MMFIENKFNLGDTLYLKTDTEQSPRLLTGINVSPSGILYSLSRGTEETKHYDIEISTEINQEMKLNV